MRGDARAARIIVVDDNKDTADLMAWWLRTGGFVVETAADGAAALALVETFKADCVLLDVLMPRVDGLELARQLRARHAHIVLIAMSGLDADDSRVADTFDLVDHHFQKPVDLDALARILEPWPAE